jgi:F-type H+-transporting ATPase subunit a
MAAGSNAPTATEYIVHHLTHLNTSGHAQQKIVDFSIVNVDTVVYSVLLAILVGWAMRAAARRVTSGVPGRFVGAVEAMVEFVHEQARSIVKGDLTYIAPLALTVFVWIVAMNTMDLLPVDLLPRIGELFGIHYMRVVPTADLNATFAMSFVVLIASLYYGIKIKHPGGFVHELVSAPFGSGIILAPFNLLLQLIEYAAKTVSLAMRLFGNMFAGELLFMLIALLGLAAAQASGIAFGAFFIGQVALATGWAIFHILIVLLQAYIFTVLPIVYISMAEQHH